mgnify:FL=1
MLFRSGSIYIDGKLSFSSSFGSSNGYMSQTVPPAPLKIADVSSIFSSCLLAEIAIYDRALSLNEIYYHYKQAGWGDNTTAIDSDDDYAELLGYWPINQGRYFSYEDLNDSGYSYTSAGTQKFNIVPNNGSNKNHLYAYSINNTLSPVNETKWKKVGNLSIKD